MTDSYSDLQAALQSLANPEKAQHLMRFFKTGPGEYGAGDRFLGITVPEQRRLAKQYRHLSLEAVAQLLESPWHEFRLTALLILTDQVRKADAARQAEIAAFYLDHTDRINNWDLVDGTCPAILGAYLLHQDRTVLYQLAASNNLWEQRIAIITTLAFIRQGQFEDTLAIATHLLCHRHDLIHKAVGWMLREVGKQDVQVLEAFLDKHSHEMPRTMLRYAIERFNPAQRQHYLKSKPISGGIPKPRSR
ncbi:DNA alkylation repair protein [Leptolyngbya sp. 'hensonii']|uniref:DNA alkylation repair protein n=1 Tax=Leptolyngbya sp. 'hensonii' TaxID=1922337 RepID=UPI00094FAC90|nr:DNA alkylation repair protein [Leptolyngbya sp. 'hensonii']OLP19113.1 DNA alkylation repair protein [Leptolyngbya sp. 'hensonii']